MKYLNNNKSHKRERQLEITGEFNMLLQARKGKLG